MAIILLREKDVAIVGSRQSEDLFSRLPEFLPQIEIALNRFAKLSPKRWFRELLLCLLTPQSSPYRAEAAMTALEKEGFFDGSLAVESIAEILRTPDHYVRFHRVKAERLLRALAQREQIERLLRSGFSPVAEREKLRAWVVGFGMKESSHALRNIGRRGLAILDRHILRVMVDSGIVSEIPSSITDKRYLELERLYLSFCAVNKISPDVLDLYLWARATGSVFK